MNVDVVFAMDVVDLRDVAGADVDERLEIRRARKSIGCLGGAGFDPHRLRFRAGRDRRWGIGRWQCRCRRAGRRQSGRNILEQQNEFLDMVHDDLGRMSRNVAERSRR